MRILYFNPETDYALASGASFYTPPAIIEKFRKEYQLLPEAYASNVDYILVDNPTSLESSNRLVGWADLATLSMDRPRICPWGWNHALHRRLIDYGLDSDLIPSEKYLDMLRQYSHRKSTIVLNEMWNKLTPQEFNVPLPEQISDVEQCIAYWHSNPSCWMKAPWSSSGRGVIYTGADLEERHIRPWCAGIIRRQGSIMAERNADKIADFASEWIMSDGHARLIGISAFETSRRGKYIANIHSAQKQLEADFNSISRIPFHHVADVQQHILESTFAGYSGPIGVDIIVNKDGTLRPFVEANLRITMGMIHLESLRDLL